MRSGSVSTEKPMPVGWHSVNETGEEIITWKRKNCFLSTRHSSLVLYQRTYTPHTRIYIPTNPAVFGNRQIQDVPPGTAMSHRG